MLARTVVTTPPGPERPSHHARAGGLTGTGRARWQAAFVGALALNLLVLYAPSPDVPGESVPGLDKVVHVAVFALLTVTGLRARFAARWFLPLVLAHAVASEVVQAVLLPDRSGDPWDLLADAAGVVIGALLVRARARRTGEHGRDRRG